MFSDYESEFKPKSIGDIIFPSDAIRSKVERLIAGVHPFPIRAGKCGILLYGIPGTGKSELAKLIPNAIQNARGGGGNAWEHIVSISPGLNGMKMIANMNSRAEFNPYGLYHYFVLDEVDQLTKDAMAILKSTMNLPDTIWILTTNNFEKIEAGVRDRCHCIPFNAAAAENWLPLARKILAKANVSGISDEALLAVIKLGNGSARAITDALFEVAFEAIQNSVSSSSTVV